MRYSPATAKHAIDTAATHAAERHPDGAWSVEQLICDGVSGGFIVTLCDDNDTHGSLEITVHFGEVLATADAG